MCEQSQHPISLHSQPNSMVDSKAGKFYLTVLLLEPIFNLLDFIPKVYIFSYWSIFPLTRSIQLGFGFLFIVFLGLASLKDIQSAYFFCTFSFCLLLVTIILLNRIELVFFQSLFLICIFLLHLSIFILGKPFLLLLSERLLLLRFIDTCLV